MVALDISHSRPRPKTRVTLATRGGPVVPQSVTGKFRRIKWTVLALCLGVYYLVPFLRWDRGPGEPSQAVLLDFERARLYVFFVELWPQDLWVLTGLLVLATLLLVLMNAVAGRIWCGFLCPQTVWTDLFYAVERMIEGDRRDILRKRAEPLSTRRVVELGLKHAIWIVISIATGGALIFYFQDAPTLIAALPRGEASAASYAWIAIFAGTTYSLAGFAREQVCTFMCPWPRLQGAIWDPKALTVNYRDYRGEERMSAKKAAIIRADGGEAGDCVDCMQCVTVCPIGIDIREGPNFACINCGLCVDACDSVMAKLDRPRGLIDYESWDNIERGRRKQQPQRKVLRPKVLALAAASLLLTGGLAGALALRSDGSLSVEHDRNPRVVRLSDGALRNAYAVKIVNRTSHARAFRLDVDGLPKARLALIGADNPARIEVAPDSSLTLRVTISSESAQDEDISFVLTDSTTGKSLVARDHFFTR